MRKVDVTFLNFGK